ncbi:unnamed protein product [Ixodes hexagonus]
MLHTSHLSTKRKRDESNTPPPDTGATAMEQTSEDPSKRLCSPKMAQGRPDEDKENTPDLVPLKPTRAATVDPPMGIQNEGGQEGLNKTGNTKTVPMFPSKEQSATKKTALADARRQQQRTSKADTLPSTMSVAARAALFETAIGAVSGTMPAPRRIPIRPMLKQTFSTVDITPTPTKKSASSVGSSPSTPLSDPSCVPADEMQTPPPAERPKSTATRKGTPRKPELPQLAIKTIPGTPRPEPVNNVHQTDTSASNPEMSAEQNMDAREYDQCKPVVVKELGKLKRDFVAGLLSDGTSEPPLEVFETPSTPEAIEESSDQPSPVPPPVQGNEQPRTAEACVSGLVQAEHNDSALQDESSMHPTQDGRVSSISVALSVERSADEAAPVSPLVQEKVKLHTAEVRRLETEQTASETHRASCALREVPMNLVAARQPMYSGRLSETDCMSPEETAIFDEIDDILNEYSDGSFQTDHASVNSCASSPAKSESHLPTAEASKNPGPQDDSAKNDVTPKRELYRTISYYRRRVEQSATPKRTSIAFGCSPKPTTSDVPLPGPEAQMSLGDSIRALQEEVRAQQTIISQASQALNLCQASAEFVGSSEQTEAERLLLIATQRRLACINEMQRLKASGDVLESDTPRGTLVISELRLPAKPELLESSKELEKNNEIIYLMFLAQYRSKVFASPLLSNEDLTDKRMSFVFHDQITISNMGEDFQVSVEIYALKTTKGVVPHDKKYHIKKDSLRLKLSSKGKKTDSIFLSPVVSSPGGPDAVRTSSFQKLGSFVLSSLTCGQKVFALSKVPNSFHLEDKAVVKVQLHAEHKIEHRGFLTLFEEVGGYGAWTRLWCLLKGSHIVCWRYPDEETTKAPYDSVDLRQCISTAPEPLPVTECARPYTFKLVVVQPLEACKGDSLTTTRYATLATTKHLFSADSREELQKWCARLGAALACIRRWNPEAYKAMDIRQLL